MNVLAIDAAIGPFSAAVASDGYIRATAQTPANAALERGLAAVAAVLETAGMTTALPDRIAVGTGPGAFTGLRIAVAFAKSLAQAWKRPLVAVSSFDALELGIAAPYVLALVAGRPGVVSARLRRPDGTSRASGFVDDVLAELLADFGDETLAVANASKDVLAALAERRIHVHSAPTIAAPPAAAIALVAAASEPAARVHAVRADYGELQPVRTPKG